MFYSRFFTTRGILKNRILGNILNEEEKLRLQQLRDFFSRNPDNDKEFKKIAREKIEQSLKTNQLQTCDAFRECVAEYYKKINQKTEDEKVFVDTFIEFEKRAWDNIETNRKSDLTDLFNSLNRDTLAYAIKSLTSDIRYSIKFKERVLEFMKRNELLIGLWVQPIFFYIIGDIYTTIQPIFREIYKMIKSLFLAINDSQII